MKFKLSQLSTVIPVIKDTFLRFPLVIICVFSATFLALLLLHKFELFGNENNARLLGTLVLSGVALISLKLLVESKGWSQQKQLIGAGLVVAIICLFTWEIVVNSAESVYVYLSLAIVISVIFAPYIKRSSTASSVWFFNYQTGVAVFFAAVAAVVLGTGLSLILLSTGYLFEIKVPDKLYGDVWIISWGLLFSVYFLANLSKEFDFKEESCSFPKGIRFITNYIMVPLMWAYMAILYAYFFKIIIQWELPRGNLGLMITLFGTVGIVTKLLAYPIRNNGTFLLKLFDKYYYYALVIPIILLGVAIGVRIHDYGLTESRYAVVLLGIWFSAVVIITAFKKEQFHIKYVPMLFAVLAFVAAVGPWSAEEWSTNSQLTRFTSILEKHGLLVDGQAVKASGQLSFEQRKSLSSIADYLTRREYRYEKIKPLFKNLLAEAKKKTETEKKKSSTKLSVIKEKQNDFVGRRGGVKLLELMGIEYVNRWVKAKNEISLSYYNTGDTDIGRTFLPVSGFDFIRKVYTYNYSRTKKNKIHRYKLIHNGTLKTIKLGNDGKNIVIQVGDDKLKFNYKEFVRGLRKNGILTKTMKNNEHFQVVLNSRDQRFKVKLNFESIYGKINPDNSIHINSLQYLLLLKFN